jgi:alcohol dehydrogenase YqhD (iron-dependent ADH family)
MTDAAFGEMGINKLKEYFNNWGMPVTLEDLGLDKSVLPLIAKKITQNPEGTALNAEEVLAVLTDCYDE